MTALAVLLLAVVPSTHSLSGTADRELLSSAEQSFAEGQSLRVDERAARIAFGRAAAAYDELWIRGNHTPALSLNRAQAHRLAGNLPRAITALNEGLARARWDRSLQNALEDARSAVGYPHGSELAALCRPAPPATIGTRLSPLDGWLIAGSIWLAAWLTAARFAMTRAASWLIVSVVCAIILAAFAAAWIVDDRTRSRDNAFPVVVVADDVLLRKGNAETYPPRLDGHQALPAGVEARMLTSRGGWLQIRLAGGAIGWIPESAALKTTG